MISSSLIRCQRIILTHTKDDRMQIIRAFQYQSWVSFICPMPSASKIFQVDSQIDNSWKWRWHILLILRASWVLQLRHWDSDCIFCAPFGIPFICALQSNIHFPKNACITQHWHLTFRSQSCLSLNFPSEIPFIHRFDFVSQLAHKLFTMNFLATIHILGI